MCQERTHPGVGLQDASSDTAAETLTINAGNQWRHEHQVGRLVRWCGSYLQPGMLDAEKWMPIPAAH